MTVISKTYFQAGAPRAQFGTRQTATPTAPEPPPFDAGLWERLQAMELDDPTVETPISKRLAAEHKWTEPETRRAIGEYKRFLYLTQRAGFEATPSRPVDLVWHEHLMHTEHYWGTLCREVLRNDLHHKPGSGDSADGNRLMSQYRRTLSAYETAFGYEPPADIWPRPSTGMTARGGAPLIIGAFAAMVGSIAFKVWLLAIVAFLVLVVAIIASLQQAANARRRDRGGCGSGCGGGGIGSTGCGDSGSSGSDGGGGDGGGGGGCGGGGD